MKSQNKKLIADLFWLQYGDEHSITTVAIILYVVSVYMYTRMPWWSNEAAYEKIGNAKMERATVIDNKILFAVNQPGLKMQVMWL